MSSNYIKNVAIVGAGGNSGKFMAEALLKTGKHTVTAITRPNSTATLADGLIVKKVDYDDPSTIVAALQGQDALVITLAAGPATAEQSKLIQAAADANVPWILPNEWGSDSASQALDKDLAMIWTGKRKARELIESLGKSSWISVTTGFWYEWSLSMSMAYGFDFEKKTVRMFDDGNTKVSTSTWSQVGLAVANLLSLKIKVDASGEACLEQFKNKHVYISSFNVSQNDMLDSVLRITGSQRSDWTIEQKPSTECFEDGAERMKNGDMSKMGDWLYGRVFFLDGVGNHEKTRGLHNEILNLPEEDLDSATERAIDRARSGVNPRY